MLLFGGGSGIAAPRVTAAELRQRLLRLLELALIGVAKALQLAAGALAASARGLTPV